MNVNTQRYSQDLRRYYRLPSVQVSLTLVLSLFVATIFIVFALRPTITTIATLNKTITESEKMLKQLDTKVKALQVAASQLEQVKTFLPKVNVSIPNNGAQYSPLTLSVEALALNTGIQLESETLGPTLLFSRILSPFTPNKNQVVIALPVSVRVVGSYPAVNSFLTQLLTMERILSIDSATIAREAATKTENAGVSLNVSGSAYYLADEAQLQKAMPERKGKK
jgi:Tfp pilus assembly protein PilO